MSKNKILTIFAATMLGSCAGFAMEFEAKTPMKPQTRTLEPIEVANQNFYLTPDTKAQIVEGKLNLLTDTGITKKVTKVLEGKKMHQRTYEVALQYGIEEELEERARVEEVLRQIASDRAAELALEEERHSMLMSVHKHKKESQAEVLNLKEILNQQQQEALQQAAASDALALQIEDLTGAMSALEIEYQKEKQTKERLVQEHEEEATGSAEREELHIQRVQKLAAQREELRLSFLESERQRKELAKACSILSERLGLERDMDAQRKESLKTLISKPSDVAVTADVIDHVGEKKPERVGDDANVVDNTLVPNAQVVKKKVKPRGKTNIGDDGEV